MKTIAYVGTFAHGCIGEAAAGTDRLICVTDGSFGADGLPRRVPEEERCRTALREGADLVLALPAIAVLSGHETRAYAAVSLMTKLEGLTELAVPVHHPDAALIDEIAMFLFREPMSYQNEVRGLMDDGRSFRAARAEAVDHVLAGAGTLLLDPYDLEAVELRLAILRHYSRLKLRLLDAARGGAEVKAGGAADDEADRRWMRGGDSAPDALLAGELHAYMRGRTDDALCSEAEMTPACTFDISRNLAARREEILRTGSFMQIAEELATKRIPASQVRRGLLMLLIGIRLPNLSIAALDAFCSYIRVGTAVSREAVTFLNEIAEKEGKALVFSDEKAAYAEPSRVRADESRLRLASFDRAARELCARVTGDRS